jgi:hypothetical protein
MPPSYQQPGVRLFRDGKAAPTLVKDLQRDLRRLGYLRTGIDGILGKATEQAIQALQFDLLHNCGTGADGASPVCVRDYNQSRIAAVNGILDENLAAAMAAMLADEQFAKIPESSNPAQENAEIVRGLAEMQPAELPVPFLLGILKQESGLKHFWEPSAANDDSFVVVGLDRRQAGGPAITSRGYGIGQHTLLHHPPTPVEVSGFILDARGNVQTAIDELRRKFLYFVNGRTPGTRAADRLAEHGPGPLRVCRYQIGDPRRLTVCRECLKEYEGVPLRKNIGCDWPYAVRRYNGDGANSYHYQAQVLLRVLNG